MVERQKILLTGLLGGATNDFDGQTLHTMHECFELDSDSKHKINLIFIEALHDFSIPLDVEHAMRDLVLRIDDDKAAEKQNIVQFDLQAEQSQLVKRQFFEIVQMVGTLESTGTLFQEAILGSSDRIRQLFSAPVRVQGFRFVTQLQRLVGLSNTKEGMILGSKIFKRYLRPKNATVHMFRTSSVHCCQAFY